MPGIARRRLPRWQALLSACRVFPIAVGLLLVLANAAAAMDVKCIEESRYKHLYQIFGEDPRKLAAYLGIDPNQERLPDPDLCRAALIAGGVGEKDEYEKILAFIIQNRGWLAAIYLSSGGGSTGSGQRLGYLVRSFRLKTYTARNIGNKLLYEPDFALPPLPGPPVSPPVSPPASPVSTVPPMPAQAPRCALKDHVPTGRDARNAAVSGVVRPELFTPTREENIDREGAAYRELSPARADPALCQKACSDDGRCRAWTYGKPEGRSDHRPYCALKERVLGLKKDGNAVSGLARPDAVDATFEEGATRAAPSYREFNLPAPDPRMCQKACIDDARCRLWVYRKPEGRSDHLPHCSLKEQAPARPDADRLSVSGMVARLQYMEPTYEPSSNREGPAYRELNLSAADARLCQKTCIDEARCRAWVYRKPEGRTDHHPHCWLKDNVSPRQGADDLTVSGMVYRAGKIEVSYEKDIDRPGSDYRSFDLPLPEPLACQKSCLDDVKCRAWTYTPPDSAFLVSLMVGWDAYHERQRAIPSDPAPSNNWCASACTFLHVAGVDRSGVIEVHRPNQGFTAMSEQAENLMRADAAIARFYEQMDPGPQVTRLFRSTSATTVTATHDTRFPRYYADYLIANCQGSDPERLQNLEVQLERVIDELSPSGSDLSLKIDQLRAALTRLHAQRRDMEQCVARAHERDRLAAFDRLCGKGCDQKKLATELDAGLATLLQPK